MMRAMRDDRTRTSAPWGWGGFTLVELLIASTIAVLILLGIYMVYDIGSTTFLRTERRSDMQQNARAALDTLARQIRVAGYVQPNPAYPPGLPRDPIVIATATALVIRGDVRVANPALLAPVDTIFGVTLVPTGGCGSPPCLMTHVPETSGTNVYSIGTASLPLAFGITSVAFTYFNNANAQLLPVPLDAVNVGAFPDGPLAPDPLPGPKAARNAVRRIVVTLTASDSPLAFAGPGSPGFERDYTVTQEIWIRNCAAPASC